MLISLSVRNNFKAWMIHELERDRERDRERVRRTEGEREIERETEREIKKINENIVA